MCRKLDPLFNKMKMCKKGVVVGLMPLFPCIVTQTNDEEKPKKKKELNEVRKKSMHSFYQEHLSIE